MQRISQIMSRNVVRVAQHDSIHYAAQLMAAHDVGALPVCDGAEIVGIVTDRDIVTRVVAAGADGRTIVGDVASGPIVWCMEDDEIEVVRRQMAQLQVRRIPVISHERKLVGMVSIGDLATRCDVSERSAIGEALDHLSQPS